MRIWRSSSLSSSSSMWPKLAVLVLEDASWHSTSVVDSPAFSAAPPLLSSYRSSAVRHRITIGGDDGTCAVCCDIASLGQRWDLCRRGVSSSSSVTRLLEFGRRRPSTWVRGKIRKSSNGTVSWSVSTLYRANCRRSTKVCANCPQLVSLSLPKSVVGLPFVLLPGYGVDRASNRRSPGTL